MSSAGAWGVILVGVAALFFGIWLLVRHNNQRCTDDCVAAGIADRPTCAWMCKYGTGSTGTTVPVRRPR